MRTISIFIAAAALSLSACKKKNDAPAAGSGSAPVATLADAAMPTPTVDAAAPTEDVAMANKAGNCPVAVAGAVGAILEDKAHPESVVLTIVGKDAAGADTIRKRAAHLVEVQAAPDAQVKHSGEGTGGGAGICPVITTKDVTIASEEIEGGVKVTMTPSGAITAAALRKDVEGRLAKIADVKNFKPTAGSGDGGGAGGGEGDHGGNHSGDGDGHGKDKKPGDAPPTGETVVPTGTGAGSQQ